MADEAKSRDITVARPFNFLYKSGAIKHFGVGVHKDVGEEVATYPHLHFHLLPDGQELPAQAVDVSDPAATAKRIASLEDEATRLRAEVEQHKDHAARAEAELAEVRAKVEQHDAIAAERDDLKARNAALEADVERLTKPATPPTPAKPAAGKPA